MAYGTTANLKMRLRVTESGDDTLLAALLESATDLIDEMNGRSWPSGADERFFGSEESIIGMDGRLLFLDGLLDPGESVTVKNGDDDTTTISSDDYELWPPNDPYPRAILLDDGYANLWEWGTNDDGQISIDGTWVVPNRVEEAAYVVAAALYRGRAIDEALAVAKQMTGNPVSLGAI